MTPNDLLRRPQGKPPECERGLVREIGTGPRDPRRRYYLAKTP
ncbi:hypothetical protein [Thermochromatium tepidum]|nr:hypothetical protein [Thermochromatium tepidum]